MKDQMERLPAPAASHEQAAAAYRLPEPLAELLSKLPPYPPRGLFVQALNRLLAPQLPDDVRISLEGRSLRLRLLERASPSISSGRERCSWRALCGRAGPVHRRQRA